MEILAPKLRAPRAFLASIGLRWRLTLYLGLALLVLLVGFLLLSLQAVRQAQRQAFSQQLRLTQTMAADLEREFNHISSDMHGYFPSEPSEASAMEALVSLQDHLANFDDLQYFRVTGVRLVDAEGGVLAMAPPETPGFHETLPLANVVRQVVSERTTLVTASRLPVEGGRPFVAVVVPLPSSPDLAPGAAVVVDTVGLANIDLFSSAGETTLVEDTENGAGHSPYEVEVLSSDGTVMVTSEGSDALGTTSYHYAVMNEFMKKGEAGAIVHRPKGTGHPDHIAAIVPLENTPFFLVTEEPLGLLLDWPQQLRSQAMVLGSIAAFVILALGWIVSQQIVRPLIALRQATAKIKQGDLDTPVRVRAKDELGRLAEEVEGMRQRLRDTVTSLDNLNRSLMVQVEERTQQLRSVMGRLMQAQEEERHRVARDLHDETAQSLTALGVILDEALLNTGQGKDKGLNSIRDAREQVRRLVDETRRLAYALRPSVLDDAGLVPALRWCTEAYLDAAGVEASLQAPEAELRCPEPVEVALFRVGQEAMSNIVRHAQASHAEITIERNGAWVTLKVKDDGMGFDVRRAMGKNGISMVSGLGLAGMKERIDLLGGRLEVSSYPGQGTTVTAMVSMDEPDGPRS